MLCAAACFLIPRSRNSARADHRGRAAVCKAKAADRLEFPDGFLWGAATAAFQIEGAAGEDGKGPSIWDEFASTEGAILNGEVPGDTCGHYRKMEEDVKHMQAVGLKAYRFSISWSRVLPQGSLAGGVNEAGIAFYERLCRALRAADIEPVVTLYHWDLPAALEVMGGWLNRDTVHHFLDYARICFQRLGPYVQLWTTINEPWTQCVLGYAIGIHAPGRRTSPGSEPYVAGHNMLLAHALAVREFREGPHAREGSKISIALNTEWYEPMDPAEQADIEAQRRQLAFHLGWFADPIYLGDYPEDMQRRCGDRLPAFTPEERELLQGSSDFFAVNMYAARYVGEPSFMRKLLAMPGNVRTGPSIVEQLHRVFRKDDPAFPAPEPGVPSYFSDLGDDLTSIDANAELSALGWPVTPWGLGKLLCHLHDRYTPGSIYVTENGVAFDQEAPEEQRTQFLMQHAAAVHSARQQGADVRGYFVWSLMDNFEWAVGTTKRFGLLEVDFETLARKERECCKWYKGLCQSNSMEYDPDLYARVLQRPQPFQ